VGEGVDAKPRRERSIPSIAAGATAEQTQPATTRMDAATFAS